MDTQFAEIKIQINEFRNHFYDEKGWPRGLSQNQSAQLCNILAKLRLAIGDDLEEEDYEAMQESVEHIHSWLTDDDGNPDSLSVGGAHSSNIGSSIDAIESVAEEYL